MKQSHLRALQRVYLVLLFSFMYVPIAVMAVFSFNESKSRTIFTGFTFKWYKSLFHNEMILSALGLSLVVALIAAVVATVVGTAAAIGINAMGKRSQAVINNISYMPVVNPEIITGVSLMLLFVVVKDGIAWANQNLGWTLPENIFGLPTLLIAHISFCLPYVIFNVSPKLRQLDVRVYEAALAPYYAGDAMTMMDENPDLGFAIPEEGTNYFVDAMCIPAGSKNKEAAEMFINYMCETSVGVANCDYIGYSTPITEVWEQLPDDLKYSEVAYPSAEVLANTEVFTVLPDEINAAMDKAWSDMKSYSEGGSSWLIPVGLVVAVAVVVLLFWSRNRKKQREDY